MTKLTENDIELWVIEELEPIGYNYKNGTDIAPDSDQPDISTYLLLKIYSPKNISTHYLSL